MNPRSILVLGGDGYIGWPLAVRLARTYPDATVTIVDNLSRRRHVAEVGGNSVTPIGDPHTRLAAFRRAYAQANLVWEEADVSTAAVDTIVERTRPQLVYHLAQQCSAPYAMSGVERAAYTVTNNEVGNLRLLWAVRAHAPEAHVVKLGTFGEYAKGGIDIAEGYFTPTWGGRTASRPMPYPRESDDIYHITKINDSNFVSMACRKWGLRVTDVMQSTLFGVVTEESRAHPDLTTRFDYDAVYGTVVNRFVAQAVAGVPMTIYGTGFQRSGLMALGDAVTSLVQLGQRRPDRGEHNVVNHVTERDVCINEIADLVARCAQAHGLYPDVSRGRFDPREERDAAKAEYRIDAHYVASCVSHTPFEDVLGPTFDAVLRHRERIAPQAFPPRVRWTEAG